MSQTPDPRETFRFGDFELDLSCYGLRRKGRPVKIERQPMDLLILLVERRPQLVSRAEIVERLWGRDVFIDVETGVNGAPCPSGATPPFHPGLNAGTINNRAGSYSPLEIQLTRTDDDQELDGVEGTAPPGLLGSLRGVGRCTDAATNNVSAPERRTPVATQR